MKVNMANKHPVLFLSHGGGPMPLLGDQAHAEMVECLQDIASKIKKPSAIIVISAHWEERVATITSSKQPDLIYDYYGFPDVAYQVQYPCLGEPVLAEQIHELFNNAGISSKLNEERGFDHGLFVPLKIMFPDADIPCVQVSLLNNLNPSEHLDLGKALQELDYDNLLIIGSGFSFHNMKAFFSHDTDANIQNKAFEEWLIETCSSTDISEQQRAERLIQWTQAPGARFCHPREEHLLPLHVCYGAAQSACTQYYELTILNKKSSMYYWPND
jgi:aromatic ring-opening dioxygenase catalytic subunit (LigB family)